MSAMSLYQKFLRYALPSVLAMWVFTIYTMVDGLFVARGVGEMALAAVNIAMPFINTIFALALWIAVGASTLIAITLGRGEDEQANQLFSFNGAVLALLAALITILAHWQLEPLARFLGATDGTLVYVQDYLGIIVLFSVCFMVAYYLEVLVKTDGFPILATVGVCVSAVTNIVLDYLFVIVWQWGIQGAAWATGISQALILLVFLFHFLRGKGQLRFVAFRWQWRVYKKVLPLGFADCITEMSTGIVIFLFNQTILLLLNDGALATYTVISYVHNIILMTMVGISQGMQPLVSFYYGQQKVATVKRLLRYGLGTMAGCSVLAFILCRWGAGWITQLFLTSGDLLQYSVYALKLFSYSILFIGVNVICSGYFAAVEEPKYSFIISLSRGVVLIALSLAITAICFGGNGIWLAPALSELLCLIVTAILWKRFGQRLACKKILEK